MIADALKFLFDLVVDAIVAVAGAVWDFFKDPIGSIQSAFDWVLDFLGGLLDGILGILKKVFLPDDDFLDTKFSSTRSKIDKKINIAEYQSAFDSLKGAKARGVPMTRSGHYFLGFDWSSLSDVFKFVDDIRPYTDWIIRGIMFYTLLMYNINNVYRLIRGGSMEEGSED